MTAAVFRDLQRSREYFTKLIMPILFRENVLGRFKFDNSIACEGEQDKLKVLLDTYSGIDFVGVDDCSKKLVGIAARIQSGRDFASFTIRLLRDSERDTELQKRIASLADGSIYPAVTLHAYVLDGSIHLGMVATRDLIEWVSRCLWGDFFGGCGEWQGFADRIKAANGRRIGHMKIQSVCEPDGRRAWFGVATWGQLRRDGVAVQEVKVAKEGGEISNE